MHHSTGTPTKAQRRRFDILQQLGCICCASEGLGHVPCQIHHVLDGGRRIGHEATLGLCPWHHVGSPPGTMTMDQAVFRLGPSLALHKRRFVETYGDEQALLAMINERLGRMLAP